MGQEAETKLKLELVPLMNEELEQPHLIRKRMAEEIHPSNTDWVLKHWTRSCENQEHPESEQATNNSGLDTDTEDYSSTCSDSGHVEKTRKINHSASKKTQQYFNQMHKDSIKLTERILALEEQSLQKLSETLPALASFIMNTNLAGCLRLKGG